MRNNTILFLTGSLVLLSCNPNPEDPEEGNSESESVRDEVVNIFSHRYYDSDKELYGIFEEQTGIRVNVKEGDDDNQIAMLKSEGEHTQADMLITVDAGRLYFAKELGLLQSIESVVLERNIPQHLRDPDDQWFALTKRARVIVYDSRIVSSDQLDTYESLTDPEWKNSILIRSSSNIYNQSLLSGIISAKGEKFALDWARGIVSNMARDPKGNDRDQMKEVAAGNGKLAIVNSYYLGKLKNSGNEMERKAAEKLLVFFPNQNDRGTHINISGAGVTKYAKNRENAVKLLEFLSSVEAQEHFALANYEYPVHQDVEPSEILKSWGDFKEDALNLNQLGRNNKKAVEIFKEVGWN